MENLTTIAGFITVVLVYLPIKLYFICVLRQWYRDLRDQMPKLNESNNVVYQQQTQGTTIETEESVDF